MAFNNTNNKQLLDVVFRDIQNYSIKGKVSVISLSLRSWAGALNFFSAPSSDSLLSSFATSKMSLKGGDP